MVSFRLQFSACNGAHALWLQSSILQLDRINTIWASHWVNGCLRAALFMVSSRSLLLECRSYSRSLADYCYPRPTFA